MSTMEPVPTAARRRRAGLAQLVGLLVAAVLAAGCAGDEGADGAADERAEQLPADSVVHSTGDYATPESVLHDEAADVYLVSNINGTPLDKDDNGFISRVAPDGSIEALRWIDGADEAVTLHAPKGMAIHGDTLFVSDIDSVRAFGRTSGEYYGARGVPGASFLNDLAVGPDGTLYVSDTGLNPDFSSSGTDAVYRFEGEQAVALTDGGGLTGPNGIVVDDGGLVVVSFAAPEARRIPTGSGVAPRPAAEPAEGTGSEAEDASGPGELLASLPGGQLDGIVRLDDGSFLVSSWETESVYRIPAGGGEPTAVVEGVPSPADIGWDAGRQRVLIPVFTENRLEFRTIR